MCGPDPAAADRVAGLLEAARAGDTAALGQVLEACRTYLLSVANRELESRLQAKAGASDLVQEAFVEAQQIIGRFAGRSADEVLAWLRAILLNKLSNFTRAYVAADKRAVHREVAWPSPSVSGSTPLPAADQSTPSGVAVRDEQSASLRRALDRLPEHYRQVLLWRHWDELSFEEIGQRLGKSPDAARMLWGRAAAHLQQQMGAP